MGRAPCCDKATVKKGPWSPEEDAELKAYIEQHGTGGNWIALPQKIGLNRCGKSCRLRWLNYLRPNIKHGGFSEEEDSIICSLYVSIGSRWSIIAAQLPGRTDNDIKNYWNTKLKKKLLGKQRKNQRTRPARWVKQEMKTESGNLFTTEAIDTYPSLQEAVPLPTVDSNEENNFKDQTSIDSFLLKLGGTFQTVNYDQQLSNSRNNHYLRCPFEISRSQDHFFGNSMAMYASSVSMNITNGTCSPSTSGCYPINWVGANNFQGYNNVPAQLDEIPYSDSQHFDGLESFSGMDMIKSSTVTTSTSPESVSWRDISSLVYPPMASNLELCQGLVPQNCTIGSSGYMGLRQPYFASMV